MAEIFKNDGRHEIPDFLSTLEEEPAEIAKSEIDAKLDELAESGLLILNGYQYLVGNLLSFNILDKIDREYSNKIMIDITNQLGNHSIDSITQLFEINLSSEKNIESENGFQKKINTKS